MLFRSGCIDIQTSQWKHITLNAKTNTLTFDINVGGLQKTAQLVDSTSYSYSIEIYFTAQTDQASLPISINEEIIEEKAIFYKNIRVINSSYYLYKGIKQYLFFQFESTVNYNPLTKIKLIENGEIRKDNIRCINQNNKGINFLCEVDLSTSFECNYCKIKYLTNCDEIGRAHV